MTKRAIIVLLVGVNLVLLAYVMGAARLADHNVVLARVLLYGLTLVLVAGVSLFFVWSITYVAPHFMTPQQAMQFLDTLKAEEKNMPFRPILRTNKQQRVFKDW